MAASAIVLAHGAEPLLVDCVAALARQGVPEILVVDNEAAAEAVAGAAALPGVTVLRPGRNLGYAGGADYAAARASGDTLFFVNSDAVVRPGAVAALTGRIADPEVGLAMASVRLAGSPDRINSAGNPIHFLMFSWVGGLGDRAADHERVTDVASISGVTFAVRREVWDELGGFDATYFAYCEDVYLSVRAWQAGYRVVLEPSAVVDHDYDFARHPAKHYLLERNRLMNLVLLPERRTLRLAAVPAAAVELGILGVAVRDGWASDKVLGWRWLLRHRGDLVRRRRAIQSARMLTDRELAHLFIGSLQPPAGLGPAVPRFVSDVLERYWAWMVERL